MWKATAATTGGAFDAFEDTVDAFAPGPPEHVHDTVDELFYVLEGELLMKLDGAQSSAPAGTFVYVPRGTSHAWVNVGTTAARMLVHFLPSPSEPPSVSQRSRSVKAPRLRIRKRKKARRR